MDILRIDSGKTGLRSKDGQPWRAALDDWLNRRPGGARITILVHGFRYAPEDRDHDPHRLIFAETTLRGRRRAISWPQHLGGHVIAFGWPARGSIWQAARQARIAGHALAALSARVRAAGFGTDYVAHSLGCLTVLTALGEMNDAAECRATLMTPAAFPSDARRALASRAGQSASILNVTTRENLAFDWMLRAAKLRLLSPTLAQGLPEAPPNWVDLAIDCPRIRARLCAHGWPIKKPVAKICHWSAYLRPGLFPIYRAFLDGGLHPRRLRAILPDTGLAKS